jgi:G6PDH family F420-dependent oxidoreductase
MVQLGYALSSEEHPARDLVRFARRAEEAGFSFALISDHYHPWTDKQGNSPYAWSVLGGIAQATNKLRIGTGVTCPTMRYHPAIIAQAAATVADMMPGRFFLGVGTGEALNEHIHGEHWPPADVRLEMLLEAVEIIRDLWTGEEQTIYSNYYTVENARIYTLPENLPPIYMAAVGDTSIQVAGQIADGLISTVPREGMVERFDTAGGKGKPHYGQVKVCFAEDEQTARQTVLEWWPIAMLAGSLHVELPTPDHFEDAVKPFGLKDLPDSLVYGPDKKKHLDLIQKMIDAGYENVYIHQVGPNQEGFFDFYQREIIPEFRS